MSRSYKKHLWTKDHNSGAKRTANRKVRHSKDIADGGSYRKIYEQYNICDWKFLHDPSPRWSNYFQEWTDPTPLWKARKK